MSLALEDIQNLLPKKNCWEFLKCGREPGGKNLDKLGICPASIDNSADGLNGGKNGGRICWAISGTFCGDRIQRSYAKKLISCRSCDFFHAVKEEEGSAFQLNKSYIKTSPDKMAECI